MCASSVGDEALQRAVRVSGENGVTGGHEEVRGVGEGGKRGKWSDGARFCL